MEEQHFPTHVNISPWLEVHGLQYGNKFLCYHVVLLG